MKVMNTFTKTMDALKHHKTHRFTISGFVVGGLLLLVGIVNLFVQGRISQLNPLSAYITLVPGLALVLRSFRPPIGMLRSIYLVVGGMMVGVFPMLITGATNRMVWISLITGFIGVGLLAAGFTRRPKDIIESI